MAITVINTDAEWNKAHPDNPRTQTVDEKTGATTTTYADGRSTTVHSRALDRDSDDYAYQRSAQGELDWFEQQHADEIASGNWNNGASPVEYRYLQKQAAKAAEGGSSDSSSGSGGSGRLTTITRGGSSGGGTGVGSGAGTGSGTYQDLLDQLEQTQLERAAADRAAATASLAQQTEKSQTENYITYRQQLAKVQDLIDSLGLGRSGATETTLADMLSDYGSGRNDINTTQNNNLASIEKTYADAANSGYQTKLQAIANYVQSQQMTNQQEIFSLLEAALTQNGESAPSKSVLAAIAAALAQGYDITDIIANLWG